ncbi:hypothetical protein H8N00_00255 [Streptomyces sp. AC563]|uniref:hypothetical protein n=1 Tax=Streptomyces buecherae TaxID=2763006 RepID=UPI00164E8CB7|nr:hypothetical protein [Streptomyces buecherae]MBC3987369.1 hypothetical protein [Streptomyces buecherae]
MDMLVPTFIPQYDGNLAKLELDIAELRHAAAGIRQRGLEVHERFQLLSAHYKAPEADQLFATTTSVRDKAADFAGKLEKVAGALETYASEIRPLAKRLEQLQIDARDFLESVEDDDDWTEDDKKVSRHNKLWRDVNATTAAFQAAERKAASTILGLVGKPGLTPDDGSHQPNMYGYDADTLNQTKELPWGSPVERTYDAWDIGHHVKTFVYDGLILDNAWGSLKGLGALFSGDGQAWGNLRDIFGGLGLYTITPYEYAMDWAFGEEEDTSTEKRMKNAFTGYLKGFVAWDMWEENPTRASSTLVYNVLTLGMVGLAGKAGKAGKAGRAGTYLDPVGAIVNLTSKAVATFPRMSDLARSLRVSLGGTPRPHGTHSVIDFDNGYQVRVENGEFTVRDPQGKVVAREPNREPSAAERAAAGEHSAPGHGTDSGAPPRDPEPVREPVGVGARGEGTTTHPGGGRSSGGSGDLPPSGGRGGSSDGPGVGGGRHDDPPSHDGTPGGARGDGSDGPGRRDDSGDTPDGRETVRQQMARFNADPKYFERFYRSDGHRRNGVRVDDFGNPLPVLARDPDNPGKWIPKSDLPPPIPERYLHPKPISGDLATLSHRSRTELEQSAAARQKAIDADNAAEKALQNAEAAHSAHPTAENKALLERAEASHSPAHGKMLRGSEKYGEDVARLHAVPDHYPHAIRVDDGAFGNNRFDQIYRNPDGRYIVVEAKGSKSADLGYRKSHTGRLVTQGTREYFDTIVQEMRKRARKNRDADEFALATKLGEALRNGKVDYVLVKAKDNNGHYAGYQMQHFDIR